MVINLPRRILLHRFNFKQKVRAVNFSPDDAFIAVTAGRKLQVWKAPGMRREFAPFVHHRTYTGHFDDITAVAWSPNGRYLCTGSKDATARVYSLDPVPGFVPVTLSGHKTNVVFASFVGDGDTVYTVSKDGACFHWMWKTKDALPAAALAALKAEGSDDDGSDDDSDGDDGAAHLRTATGVLASRDRTHAVPHPVAVSHSTFSVLEGEWHLHAKHFFNADNARVNSVAFHDASGMLVVGFSSGMFGVYLMPDFSLVHTLSISQNAVNTTAVNSSGEWLAFGSKTLGQLLVWEWQSETCACCRCLVVASVAVGGVVRVLSSPRIQPMRHRCAETARPLLRPQHPRVLQRRPADCHGR